MPPLSVDTTRLSRSLDIAALSADSRTVTTERVHRKATPAVRLPHQQSLHRRHQA